MNDEIRRALASDLTVDITTTGRRTGSPRRIEIWFHNVDGRIFMTGLPGTRDWYANLLSDPSFTFHLKESTRADLEATAIPITEEAERRDILSLITRRGGARAPLEEWVARSPLVEVEFGG